MLTFQSPGAWAAFMDALESILSDDGFARLHAEYPAWRAHKTTEDLRDNVSEYQLIEASRKLGLSSNGEMKILRGLSAKRNKCANPSGLVPHFNDTLGYVAEKIDWLQALTGRSV